MKSGRFIWVTTYRDILRELRGTHFFKALMVTAMVLVLGAIAMFLAEPDGPNAVADLSDALWWAVVTVTTVGYGDVVPRTVPGRLIGLVIMVSGIFLVSLMTASIASVFVSRKIKEGKGLQEVRDSGHIIVCGWNEGGRILIQGLAHQFQPKAPVIVLVNELTREDVDSILYHFKDLDFRYVRGDHTREEVLARANVREARAAVILADAVTKAETSQNQADERTIFCCLAIKSMAPKVKTCAELKNPDNREHLKRALVDEIVVRGEFTPAVRAGAAASDGLSTVMKRLLDIDAENKLWRARIPDRLQGHPVGELVEFFNKKYQATLIALVSETPPLRLEDILSPDATAIDTFIRRKFQESGRDYFASGKQRTQVLMNPSWDHVPGRHDWAVVLGRVRPGEDSWLEKSLDLVTGGSRSE